MGNVLAQPVRVPVDPLADLPGVVQKDSLGGGLSLMPRLSSPGTPPCGTDRVDYECSICVQHGAVLLWVVCTERQGRVRGVAVVRTDLAAEPHRRGCRAPAALWQRCSLHSTWGGDVALPWVHGSTVAISTSADPSLSPVPLLHHPAQRTAPLTTHVPPLWMR